MTDMWSNDPDRTTRREGSTPLPDIAGITFGQMARAASIPVASSRSFEVTVTIKVTLPLEDSYDWNCYRDSALERDLLADDGLDDTFGAARHRENVAVTAAMALDYLERGSGCSAATYVISDTTESREY